MTLDEFIAKLAETRGLIDWQLDGWGSIRGRVPNDPSAPICCPITGVEYNMSGGWDAHEDGEYYKSAEVMGLSIEDADLIVPAADLFETEPGFDRELRKRMLEALGLQEKQT